MEADGAVSVSSGGASPLAGRPVASPGGAGAVADAAAAAVSDPDRKQGSSFDENTKTLSADGFPATAATRKTISSLAQKFHDELVLPMMEARHSARRPADGAGPSRWGLVARSIGLAGGLHQRDLYTTAADKLRQESTSQTLQRLQAEFDRSGSGAALRRVLKEAISQEQRRLGPLQRAGEAAALLVLQPALEKAMQEVGEHAVDALHRDALVGLDAVRVCLQRAARTAQLCARETDRLDTAIVLVAEISGGGGSAHATTVMGLLTGTHDLLERWSRQQRELNDELALRGGCLRRAAEALPHLRDFMVATIGVVECDTTVPLHSYGRPDGIRAFVSDACAALGIDTATTELFTDMMDLFASRNASRDDTVFDDYVRMMLCYDSTRVSWMQCMEGPLIDDTVLADEEARRREEAAVAAARAAKLAKRNLRRLEDHLWGHVVQYEVAVKTSDKRGAGTDANVHIVLYGADADSGEIPLYIVGDSGDKFEREALDVFIVNSLWVGKLQKIRVGHDAVGLGSGWHLERIVVHDCLGDTYFFPSSQWIDVTSKAQVNRELLPKPKLEKLQTYMEPSDMPHANNPKLTKYNVKVFTGSMKGAGTDANVRLMLFGELGYSGPWTLNNRFHDDFERGRIDSFTFEAVCLGSLHSIQIGHDGRGLGADWFLDQVAISEPSSDDLFIFPCKRWLGGKMGGGDATAEVLLTCVGQAGNLTAYAVYVHTGDEIGAGTDANVKIRMYGTERDSGWCPLEASMTHRDKFERNHVDEFLLELPFLGKIKRISICHDGAGIGAGWYLGRVSIKNVIDSSKYDFPCYRWLDSGSGDRQIMRDMICRTRGNQHLVPARGIGKSSHLTQYKVTVFTGMLNNAGTDANVTVSLFGEYGRSGPWRLKKPFRDLFEKGQMDQFIIEAAFLGELRAIKIGHDGKRSKLGPMAQNSAWYLETVFIQDQLNGGEWEFGCRAWLDTKLSTDGKRYKTLPGRRSNFAEQTEQAREHSKTAMAKWLESLDLGKHASKFEQHEIDPDVLPALTSEHLAAMGLNMEDRSRVMAAVTESGKTSERKRAQDLEENKRQLELTT